MYVLAAPVLVLNYTMSYQSSYGAAVRLLLSYAVTPPVLKEAALLGCASTPGCPPLNDVFVLLGIPYQQHLNPIVFLGPIFV